MVVGVVALNAAERKLLLLLYYYYKSYFSNLNLIRFI